MRYNYKWIACANLQRKRGLNLDNVFLSGWFCSLAKWTWLATWQNKVCVRKMRFEPIKGVWCSTGLIELILRAKISEKAGMRQWREMGIIAVGSYRGLTTYLWGKDRLGGGVKLDAQPMKNAPYTEFSSLHNVLVYWLETSFVPNRRLFASVHRQLATKFSKV